MGSPITSADAVGVPETGVVENRCSKHSKIPEAILARDQISLLKIESKIATHLFFCDLAHKPECTITLVAANYEQLLPAHVPHKLKNMPANGAWEAITRN